MPMSLTTQACFDIPVLIADIPDQIRIVYKKELEVIPIVGWSLRWRSYIGIDRRGKTEAVKSFEQAAKKIREVLRFRYMRKEPERWMENCSRSSEELSTLQ